MMEVSQTSRLHSIYKSSCFESSSTDLLCYHHQQNRNGSYLCI